MQTEMKYMGLEDDGVDDLSKITDESTLHEGKKFWSKTPLLINMLVLFVHRLLDQNGICIKNYNFWFKNYGEKWSRIFFEELHGQC